MKQFTLAAFALLSLVLGTAASIAPAHAYTFPGYYQNSNGGVQGGSH